MRPPSRRIVASLLSLAGALFAGRLALADPPGWPEAIEDNSFFLEEAYNQEKYVVQHISGFWVDRPTDATSYSFTQEWPVRGQRHQLSYTIGYGWQDGGRLGDLLLNYRYQLVSAEGWAAVAPRLSLLWPAGTDGGRGPLGFQVALPASKRVSAGLALHVNAGATVRRGGQGDSFSAGASAIWLLSPTLNLMLETLASSDQAASESGPAVRRITTLVSPGLRYAINRGSLQIVPGLALPIRVSGDGRGLGVFVYLSFEHPYRHVP